MRVCVVVLLALTACVGDTLVPTEAETRSAFVLPQHPCALVSVADVEAATDSQVVRSGLLPDERKNFPEGPNDCEYVTHGMHGSISVTVRPSGAREFDRLRDRDPLNVVTIRGLGDEAFAHALASIFVRVGDGYFALGTQHGAGWQGVRDLQRLAAAAID